MAINNPPHGNGTYAAVTDNHLTIRSGTGLISSQTVVSDPAYSRLLDEGGDALREAMAEALVSGASMLEVVAKRWSEIREAQRAERDAALEELLKLAALTTS